ncbi:tyrosine-type recombinase/integrase, partial [Actinosynnema sp.]|uniref:tyrosine-type recombinase/integrase n=1 Tax=Actinosynnema sp. TaxID=1872144 RepID=UPI003F826042
PATKRCSRVAVGSFFRWAVKARLIEESPVDDVETISVPRGLPRPIAHDSLQQALWDADDRTRLALMLAAYAGLRRGEIARLHTSQVAATQLSVTGKGGHQRMVPIDPRGDLALELTAELERRRRGVHGTGWSGPFVSAHGYLFPSTLHAGPMTASALGRIISEALPEHWTSHTLRHRFATDAYASERDLMAVQQLLGHARPETTSVYAQVPQGALLAAVVGAGPSRLRAGSAPVERPPAYPAAGPDRSS